MILILVYTWEIQDKNNVHFATLLNERELILCSILLVLHTGWDKFLNCYHGIQFLEQWKQQQQHQGGSYLYTLYVVGVYLKKSWVKKKLKWNEWNKIK